MEVYVLYLEMYQEWACENGACDLIGVYSSKEKVLDRLKELLHGEQDNGYIIGIYDKTIDDYIDRIKESGTLSTPVYIGICQNLQSYDSGFNEGCYVIRKVQVK